MDFKGRAVRRASAVLACGLALLASGDGAQARAASLKTLYNFCSRGDCRDGFNPAALLRDPSGTLYGTTYGGGQYGRGGMVYRFSGGRPHNLYSFCKRSHPRCVTGAGPGPLIVDVAGNLYGTTQGLGAHGFGNVFELSPNADRSVWTFRVLYDFCAQGGSHCTDGANPGTHAGLTYAGAASGAAYDGVSPLYGTTGGITNTADGSVVYQLVPSAGQTSWAYSVIYTFCPDVFDCGDGLKPNAGMIMDPDGNLLGTTVYGGAHSRGTVFKLAPAGGGSWTESVLYSFCVQTDCRDGDGPATELVADTSGNLYGTTRYGGRTCPFDVTVIFQCGVLFELSPNGADWTQSVLHTFCQQETCKDGGHPDAALTMDASGTLFGTTDSGGLDTDAPGSGTVFKLVGTSFHHVLSFCALAGCADGTTPRAAMVMDATGTLYGITQSGGTGAFGGGTLFKLKP